MQPFLEKLAKQLFAEYGENISRLCIVFPNRRAGLFMKQYISRLITKPIWLPDIYALEDFVVLKSKLKVPDQLTLTVKLYGVYQSIEKEKAKSFSDFLSWGNMLLSDFDELDQYLADGEEAFTFLDELKAMKQWNPDGTPLTDFERNYLEFYNSLAPIYRQFKDELYKAGEGYFGMAFAHMIDQLDQESFNEWDQVIFAGFNALTAAEEKLFTHMLAVKKAGIFWDADEYYLLDKRQEAGHFLRNYMHDKKFGEMKWISQAFRTGEKIISIIGVPGNVGQAKLAGQLTSGMIRTIDPSDIALVLVDEGLMLPVLNSIPAGLEHFNVTMGYPMKLTPVFTLFDAVFKLFINARKYARKSVDSSGKEFYVQRFYHKDIERLLIHPYIAGQLVHSFEKPGDNNSGPGKSYYSSGELISYMKKAGPWLSGLFSGILKSETILPIDITDLLTALINHYRIYFRKLEEESGRQLDLEYLYQFSILLERIEGIIAEPGLLNDLGTLYEIITSQVSTMRLPFYGEPLKGLQIMGMLETRTLDFRNIIILSVNEGQLPKGKHQNTFLPDDVRKQYSLPRYNERNAVFGYHFYRLLQQAENIFLLYNTEGNELGGGEKSRFITQIKYELPSYNPNIRIGETILSIPPAGHKDLPILINKDKLIFDRLKEIAGVGFSPTALGRYLSCSLQFCFSNVMKISEPDLVEESIDAATLGEVVHQVLQNMYEPFLGKKVVSKDIDEIFAPAKNEVRKVFLSKYPTTDLDSGKNLLILKVAENMIKRFLQAEKAYLSKLPPYQQEIEILELEQWLEAILNVPDAVTGELMDVRIRGKADRIDRVSGVSRIIDYKTGQVKNAEVKFEEIGQLLLHDSPAKMLQLLSYALMFRKMHAGLDGRSKDLVSGIVSLRFSSRYLINASIGKEELLTEDHLREIEELLTGLLSEVFNPEIPFRQTENLEVCKYCAYQKICNKVVN